MLFLCSVHKSPGSFYEYEGFLKMGIMEAESWEDARNQMAKACQCEPMEVEWAEVGEALNVMTIYGENNGE